MLAGADTLCLLVEERADFAAFLATLSAVHSRRGPGGAGRGRGAADGDRRPPGRALSELSGLGRTKLARRIGG